MGNHEERDLLSQLKQVITDLYWVRETDEPWEAMALDGEPNHEVIAQLSGKSPVKTQDFAKFFVTAITEEDWHNEQEKADVKRYRKLMKLLQENLERITIYEAGNVEIDIFVTGRTKAGEWIVLQTMAVET
ncbi:MAG: hypothetical protein F6K10_19210 [Moorea sp. SIO2B7]|nr:hypothetical protein [Moorena sp. SIO2B7]